uniref:XRE family transcription regulator n=1 Tax=Nocardiopsis sp. CMB-M0232 TaxID=1231934 RepID=A0A0D5BUL8_9ACTN|nr:XRE family transcription regulator [Nocardiopsis sp. CMB-M0232]
MHEPVLRAVPDEPVVRPVPRAPQEDHGAAADPLMRDLVGATLRRIRLEQGRTLRDVADSAQVSLPYLSEIERGRKEPSSEVLAAIHRALGLRLIDLLDFLHLEMAPVAPAPMAAPAPAAPRSFGGSRALMLAA